VCGAKVSRTYNWCWPVLDIYEEPSIPFAAQFLEKNAGKIQVLVSIPVMVPSNFV
jgi:hypothetical protein